MFAEDDFSRAWSGRQYTGPVTPKASIILGVIKDGNLQ